MTAVDRAHELHPRNKGLRGAYLRGARTFFQQREPYQVYSFSGWGRALQHAYRLGYDEAKRGDVEQP